MVTSSARSVEEYLDELPPGRRDVISAVRDEIRRSLPPGYVETMDWGMIAYEVPLAVYPTTYNGKPLMFAALAAQKNHYAVYLTSQYMRPEGVEALRAAFERAGGKLDMGKSCVRFRKLEDLPLHVIGDEIRSVPLEEFIRQYEAGRQT